MKLAKEYQGHYMDVIYSDERIQGIINGTGEVVDGLTMGEVIEKFKNQVKAQEGRFAEF
ncbi:hypothetical protein [Eubacterium sp. 1001713B170207_170306_E7]|uniref:hypothetical protein n=1 Tax=Eubacterium sp. 1001713B170207_170306_E7 TaxID=2787097 RepID=UPI0018980F48|nr:hypothetical protein [Eubacterium sp. 1001713B170207_170306_E7]